MAILMRLESFLALGERNKRVIDLNKVYGDDDNGVSFLFRMLSAHYRLTFHRSKHRN